MAARAKKRGAVGYMISSVAELYKVHPQTLRLYERHGLIKPSRSEGNTRLYTPADIERLEIVLNLARDMGVNLAGIEIILNMREKMNRMQGQMEQFLRLLQQELARGVSPAHANPPKGAIVRTSAPPRPPRAGSGRRS
jgi:MerR family transcriptional regulator/heat shock protein HspR